MQKGATTMSRQAATGSRRAAARSLRPWALLLLLLPLLERRAAAQSQAWIYATDQTEMVSVGG